MAKFGGITILLLVALRMAGGYHFFSEGLKKLEPGWSSAGFLRGAKGPLAEQYKKYVAAPHRAEELLAAKPLAGKSVTAALEAEVTEDWRKLTEAFGKLPGQTEAAQTAAKAALENRLKQVAEYFKGEATAVGDYQNEIKRLRETLEVAPAGKLPFNDERITSKQTEVTRIAQKWLADLRGFDAALASDLRGAAGEGVSAEAVEGLLNPPSPLRTIDRRVTWVVIGVGVCLFLGLFTRIAAVVGAGFLLSVMASQPPWVHGANTEYFFYQLVELFAFLVLAAVGAGQWLGFDAVWRKFAKAKDF